jgi:hypothetical protein
MRSRAPDVELGVMVGADALIATADSEPAADLAYRYCS